MWTAILATLNLVEGRGLRRLVGQHRRGVPRGGRRRRCAPRPRARRLTQADGLRRHRLDAPPERARGLPAALEPQLDGVEVLVYEGTHEPAGAARAVSVGAFRRPTGRARPELWRDGIDAAAGEIVALTIAPMVPAPDWLRRSATQLARARGDRRRDRARTSACGSSTCAEYFCRYARDMRPFEGARTSTSRATTPRTSAALDRARELYRDGFWEPVVTGAWPKRASCSWHTPEVVVSHGPLAGFRAFVRQRLAHGRRTATSGASASAGDVTSSGCSPRPSCRS